MLSRTGYLLAITLVLLPWYVVRFSLGPIPATLLEVMILLAFGSWLAEKVDRQSVGHLKDVVWLLWRQKKWWLVWGGVFIAAATVGMIISPSTRQALGAYKAYIIEPILLAIVVFDYAQRPQYRQMIVISLGLTGLVVSLLCLSQWLLSWPNWAPAELAQHRSSAMFNSANDVGLFVAPIVFLAVGQLTTAQSKRIRWYWICLIALGLVAIGLSKSRGAVVGLAAGGLFWAVLWMARPLLAYWRRWWRLMAVWLVLAYVVGISLYLGLFNHPPKVANPYSRPGFTTLTVRQCTWQGTVRMLRTTPLLGAGLAGFTERYLHYFTCDAEPLVYPHNQLLTSWSELGLAGSLAMFGLIVLYFFECGDWLVQPNGYAWAAAGVAIMVYWLAHGLVDVPYFKNDLSSLWWVMTSLFMSVDRSPRPLLDNG